MSDDDAAIADTMAVEILSKAETPMEIAFHPLTVLQLTGLIQLACRHPDLSVEHHATAERWVRAAQQYFADAPTVLDVIRRGDDPAEDLPR